MLSHSEKLSSDAVVDAVTDESSPDPRFIRSSAVASISRRCCVPPVIERLPLLSTGFLLLPLFSSAPLKSSVLLPKRASSASIVTPSFVLGSASSFTSNRSSRISPLKAMLVDPSLIAVSFRMTLERSFLSPLACLALSSSGRTNVPCFSAVTNVLSTLHATTHASASFS